MIDPAGASGAVDAKADATMGPHTSHQHGPRTEPTTTAHATESSTTLSANTRAATSVGGSAAVEREEGDDRWGGWVGGSSNTAPQNATPHSDVLSHDNTRLPQAHTLSEHADSHAPKKPDPRIGEWQQDVANAN